MRQGVGRASPTRVMALVSSREPYRASPNLKRCFALSASSHVAARCLLAVLGLVTGVLAFLLGRFYLRRTSERTMPRLTLDATGVRLGGAATRARLGDAAAMSRPSQTLVDFSRPFGMTLLANRARDRIVLAVTTAERAVYFGARLDADDRPTYASLIAKASTVSDDDAVLDATGPDGTPLQVRIRDLQDLATTLLRADRQAFDRCFLSDTHGLPVVLDGPTLCIGRQGFDLRAPLEWRATLFQEPFGALMPLSDLDATLSPSAGVMVYQATWVRQGMSESVLVSLLASLSSLALPESAPQGEVPEVASAVLRDLRLMQATPDAPPPTELRVGIERMYMLRLRAALDRAPRTSYKSLPSAATR